MQLDKVYATRISEPKACTQTLIYNHKLNLNLYLIYRLHKKHYQCIIEEFIVCKIIILHGTYSAMSLTN